MNLEEYREIQEAIWKSIFAGYKDASFSGVRGNALYFSQSWPVQTLKESDYQNQWEPSNPTGSMLASENISRLVDPIPMLKENYTPSGNEAERVYQLILETNQPVEDTLSIQSAALAGSNNMEKEIPAWKWVDPVTPQGKKIRTVVFEQYYMERLELEQKCANTEANFNANRLQYDLSDPEEKKEWEQISGKLENELNIARENSRMYEMKTPGEMRMKVMGADRVNPVIRAFNEAKDIFDKTAVASIIQPALSYHVSYISPANFADPNSAQFWPDVKIKLPDTRNPKRGMRVLFKFCRVDILRPWFILYPLEMNGWKIQGEPPGWLSNGQPQNNPGIFPLLPLAMIVARDLCVKGMGENAGLTFYEAKGIQILAWINRVIPFMPPS